MYIAHLLTINLFIYFNVYLLLSFIFTFDYAILFAGKVEIIRVLLNISYVSVGENFFRQQFLQTVIHIILYDDTIEMDAANSAFAADVTYLRQNDTNPSSIVKPRRRRFSDPINIRGM